MYISCVQNVSEEEEQRQRVKSSDDISQASQVEITQFNLEYKSNDDNKIKAKTNSYKIILSKKAHQ